MAYLLGVREARQKSEIRTACWNIPGLSLIHLGLVMSRWFWPLGVFWPGRWGLLPARVMITAGSSEEREVVVSLSHVQMFVTPWTAARQASLTFTISGACSNSCPSSWWCHPTASSFVSLFSFCLQSFPASRSFPISWLSTSGGQHIGASASASVLPMNIQGWFPLG